MFHTRYGALVVGLCVAGLLASAAPARATISIREIVDHPDSWADAQVTVVGTVVNLTLGYQGQSIYTVAGDGRRINVVSAKPAPTVGDHLQVSGKIDRRPPNEEFDFPPVLVESARQSAP